MWAAIINILLGLWLMISPDLLQMGKTASANFYITGPVVLTFAIIAISEVNRSARFLNLAIGAWLVISPFVLNLQSSVDIWNTILSGILIAGFSLIKGRVKGKYGGGWKSLFEKDPAHLHQ